MHTIEKVCLLLFILFVVCKVKAESGLYCINKQTSQIVSFNGDLNYDDSSFHQVWEHGFKLICQNMKPFDISEEFKVGIKQSLGFEISSRILVVNDFKFISHVHVLIQMSQFEFYKRRSKKCELINMSSSFDLIKSYFGLAITKNESQMMNVAQLYKKFRSVFGDMKITLILASNVFVRDKVSRILFKNAKMDHFELIKLTNTSIRRNTFRIVQDDDLFEFEEEIINESAAAAGLNRTVVFLNSTIATLSLYDFYNIILTSEMIDRIVFKDLTFIYISSKIAGIEESFFKSFKKLNSFWLLLHNFREFWHSSADNKWLIHLNEHRKWNFASSTNSYTVLNEQTMQWYRTAEFYIKVCHPPGIPYDYPDEDICLFRHFPHENAVFYEIFSHSYFFSLDKSNVNLTVYVRTCTLYHMLRYAFVIEKMHPNNDLYKLVYEFDSLRDCDLDLLIQRCIFNNSAQDLQFKPLKEIDMNDFSYVLNWLELIGPIYTYPVISAVGIITNLLIIIVIRHKCNSEIIDLKNKNSQRMFNYIIINSSLNILECLISSFTLMSECLGMGSLFCSSIMEENFTQYIKIYMINYFGEVVKTASVLVMILFSWERYTITVDKENRLSKANLYIIVIAVILISSMSSYTKLNDYDMHNYFLPQTESPMLDIFYMVLRKKWFNSVIYVLHYILNDFVLLLINLIIDILLVRVIRKDLKSKKKFANQNYDNNNSSENNNQNAIIEAKYKAKLDEIKKANRSTIKLIVYSSILYLTCRLPEVCFFLFMIFANKNNQYLIHTLGPLGVNVVEYMYVLSYSFNILFYLKFNSQFRKGFKNYFNMNNTNKKDSNNKKSKNKK